MKTIVLIIIVSTFSLLCNGQRIIEKTYQTNKNETLDFDFQFAGDISVKTWNKNEVKIKVVININDNSDNEKFHLKHNNTGKTLRLYSEYDELKSKGKDRICIEKEGKSWVYDGNRTRIEVDYELTIPKDAKVKFNTISGNMEIKEFYGPIDAKTISGFIDLSIPADTKADLKMKTISGEIYSNHEIDYGMHGNMRQIVGQNIKGSLNGGGYDISLETISGEIYLRKQ